MTSQNTSVEVRAVWKRFTEQKAKKVIPVLEDFSLKISGNELLVLIGPSGCGKSTLLKMIAGLVQPDSGQILAMETPITRSNPFAITIFQDYSLLPWRTALRNVELPLEAEAWKISGKKARRDMAIKALTKVGLGDRLSSFPRELSGGMQQRVALARSLVVKSPILLMDEPFGALDAQTRSEMQRMLITLWLDVKNLVIFVTHDLEEALILADRIIVLSERPARILGEFIIDRKQPRGSGFLLQDKANELRQAILKLLYRNETAST